MSRDKSNFLAERVTEIRTTLSLQDPLVLAANTAAKLQDDHFELTVWGEDVTVNAQDFIARNSETSEPLNGSTQALLAYYFQTADGTPPSGNWISFSQMSDGQFYAAAFQGYTGNELAKVFGNDINSFTETSVKLGGQKKIFADIAFVFPVLPLVSFLVAGWRGDEDFPSSYRILFDGQVHHHLPTDVCAISGGMLTRRLIKTFKSGL
jgi:hypothetical protein